VDFLPTSLHSNRNSLQLRNRLRIPWLEIWKSVVDTTISRFERGSRH